MTDIAILRDGTPVRLSSFKDIFFDVDGFLIQFTFDSLNPDTYRYHQHYEFKREDRKKPKLSGYYNEKLFLKYIQNIEPIPKLEELDKYNFERNLATEGEEITVSTIDFDEPYDYFYNEKKYTFKLKNTLDNKGVRNYLQPVVENFRTVDTKINTDGVNPVIVLNNQSTFPGGYFYKKNLGDFINTWSISNIQKSLIKKAMGKIIFKIREINRDIIPIIATHTSFFKKENDIANGIIDYNDPLKGFTDLEKLLFQFKKTWGYYYDIPLEGLPRPHKDDFEALFSISSTYEDYLSYLSSLQNFYDICYKTKGLASYPVDDKIEYLLKILSPSALTVIPYDLIIKAIKKYLTITLSEEDQRVVVKLVISITPSHANDFLDFLLEKENGEKTNFQAIYDALTDARLERYPFAEWFVDEQPNRMYFAFALYKLWKVSKYDLNYIRPGVVVPDIWPNFKGVDPNNYFYLNPKEYNEKFFLTFISSSEGLIVTSRQSFESEINDKKIDITKIYADVSYIVGGRTRTGRETFGSFHFYQQISFCGYESNLDLKIPTSATIPAFLFHFIKEYDRLADFDAGISLAINLTTDALLFYFTGGASIFNDLQYLKHTTKIGKALVGGLESTEAVEVWRGIEAGSETFTLTAGSLTHINQYLITTENNEEKRKILEGSQKVFLSLTFLGAGTSLTARAHATREAGKVLDAIEALPSGVSHGLSLEMVDLFTTLKGNKAVTLTLFGNKLNNLDLAGKTNFILIKYNSVLTDAQKLKFWNDFQHIDDPAFWRLLNSGKDASGAINGSFIDNWISLSERGLQEAKFTDYICNQKRADALISYVDKPNINPILSKLSYERKLVLIDTFGIENVAKFADDPQLINKWKRYYDELTFRNEFIKLNKNAQIEFLKEYGNCSEEIFKKFKTNSKLFEHWKDCHFEYLQFRHEIKYLEEVNHFKTVDLNAYDHLAIFKNRPKSGQPNTKFNCTGGHTESIHLTGSTPTLTTNIGIEVLDPNYSHVIDVSTTSQKMIDYLNNIGNKIYNKTSLSNGHFEHRNILFKVDPQPTTLNNQWSQQWILNGELYEFKGIHTQYNPLWTKEKIIHDMAFASTNKILVPSTATQQNPKIKSALEAVHGSSREWIEISYTSQLLDGSIVKIKHVNHHRYNLQPIFENHYAYFEIQ